MKLADLDITSEQASEAAECLSEFPAIVADADLLAMLVKLAENIKSQSPSVVSIAGSQGSGKSTLTRCLQILLQHQCDRRAVILSLDDFYLTRAERQHLAETVHPLLLTRGVPGTHDAELMLSVKNQLLAGEAVEAPVFDKAEDDRSGVVVLQPADVVLCEGWCWGAHPEPPERLVDPINLLERSDDGTGAWRRYVNTQLENYQTVFAADVSVFLQAPSMQAVIDWRWQQEQELAAKRVGSQVMDRQQVEAFIARYERLTKWMMVDQPSRVNLLAQFDQAHRLTAAVFG